MNDERDDEVDKFIGTINAEELKREELSERWRQRVRDDEAKKLAQKKGADLSRMSDAEFAEYRRQFGF